MELCLLCIRPPSDLSPEDSDLTTAEVTDLEKNTFILGFSWLKCHNPDIDWTKGTVKMTCCSQHCHMLQPKSAFLASLEKEEYDIQHQVHETIHALEVQQEKPAEKTPEELVPKEYHKFLKVFSKRNLSTCCLGNHGIMQLISRTCLSQRKATSFLYLQQSKKRLQCSLMTN